MPKNIQLNNLLEKYIINHSNKLNPILNEVIKYNNSLGDQKKLQISVSQAQLLQIIIRISKVKKILEIGSFTGFSALSMSLALPDDGKLVSIDKNIEFSKKAKSFYEKANDQKIKQIIKPALQSLKELIISKEKFDLIFIDADKENYINYYELSYKLISNKGLIIIDNVLWKGDVIDKSKNDRMTEIIRKFNKHVKNDQRVEKTILPIGDGVTICRKI